MLVVHGLWEREASACLIMLSAKQDSHWYHFYNVFGITRPGIDPTPILTYRTRSGGSTTWAIADGTAIYLTDFYSAIKNKIQCMLGVSNTCVLLLP